MEKSIPWEGVFNGPAKSLAGHLTLENVTVNPQCTQISICFSSNVLVEEEAYLYIRNHIRKSFEGVNVKLTIRSPQLKEAFCLEPEAYKSFFLKCIKRKFPSCAPFFTKADFSCQAETLSITVEDPLAPQMLKEAGVDTYIKRLIRDLFLADMRVVFLSAQLRKEQIQEIQARRREEEERAMTEMLRHQKEEHKKETHGKESSVVYGRSINMDPVNIKTLDEESGRVVIEGEILNCETRQTKQGDMQILSFCVTDYTETIKCKAFLRYRVRKNRLNDNQETATSRVEYTKEEIKAVESVIEAIKVGERIAVRGETKMDTFDHCLTLTVSDIEKREKILRQDTAERKRIELHMHTNMSEMDGLSSAKSLIERAALWGHPAVAITDHGVVQAFPEAFATAKKKSIKLIPGMEGYLTDTTNVVINEEHRALKDDIVVVDFETTGLNTRTCRIIEIGAVRIRNGQIVEEFSSFVNPQEPIPKAVSALTGITDAMVSSAETADKAIPKLLEFMDGSVFAAHNAKFDSSFLINECNRIGISWTAPILDTLELSRRLYPSLKTHKLGTICKTLGISLKNAHRAVHDAHATALALNRMIEQLQEHGINWLDEINTSLSTGAVGESYHIILLAASQEGMTNLNRIVSEGHLHYFNRRPHTPRSVLQKYRKGLIVGSACAAGELFRAIADGKDERELKRIARFYDYLEIQPIDNNAFMLREGTVDDVEHLREYNRRIVWLGEELGIPVCATGDVHFLDPKDAQFRAIIQNMQGFKDADEQPPLYFKTTQEMLEEFSYLGKEKCEEVVIDNPALIASRIGDVGLYPKHPEGKETFQPYWPEAADDIRRLCEEKIRDLYGDNPPSIVVERKDKELKSILGYGYGTLYSIAQKLVKKSNSDGYLVGSRGSVGSSYVAHLVGISEVNALPPHYRCPNCKYTDFTIDRKKYKVGVDLPPAKCPQCGSDLEREGFDIPFEVFLGFKGDKVPDIDLNFSGVYQPKAHAYIEELFGKGYCYRAGTIGTLAEKTAFGFVKRYCEDRSLHLSTAEMDRLAQGCVGVKRTTGQHPAGMVVLPKEYEIYQFVAIQHPANDITSPVITTHYDFSSMHDVLVKLDVLGHDDPTMIRMLMDLTGIDAQTRPLTDPKVISLFSSTEALGVTPEQIGSNTGTYGVPEFGTSFVRGMLEETKPSTMEELIRISGLSHGTDVWLGNAQDIIRSGIAPLSSCICCRDDIMNALIDYEVDSKLAFTTMESVRKGRGLTPEMEAAMQEHHVPSWFIDSCKKIKYMFPKGHAVAYVTMALRIAWYKVYRPAAYYCAYYTVRADGFDASILGGSLETVRQNYADLQKKKKENAREFTDKDDKIMIIMEIVIEMLCRGIEFLPVDLQMSDADSFQLVSDHQIRMPFTAVPGLGKTAAESIVAARLESPFISVEDLMSRTKLSTSLCDEMRENGCFKDLPETNQITLF